MTNKQALRVPERKKHNWGQAVMRDCDFCQQWALTVKHDDGGCICASCCDSEYTADLKATLATALERVEAAEKRVAELGANNDSAHEALLKARRKTVTLPSGYSVRPGHPINETERSVMIPKDGGPWLSRFDVEHALRAAGIRINGEG